MSVSIDKKVVEMVFNNKDFMTNMSNTSKALDSFDQQVNNLGKNSGLPNMGSAAEKVSIKFDALRVVAENVLGRITTSVMDAVGKINGKLNELTFDQIGAGFNKYEEKIKSVQTIMNATGESIETVNEQLDKLMWYSDETSYSFTDMTSNVGKFTSVGISLDDAVTSMMGIANWAALSGAGVEQASRAMYNFSQAMGAGVMMTKDWVSIENANMATKEFKETVIETAKELKTMGKLGDDYDFDLDSLTFENFRESLSEGWFTQPIMEEALKKYGNYTEELYKIKQEFEDIGEYKTVDELKQIYDERLRESDEIIKSLSETYTKYGKDSKEFRDIINQNGITMQTALDLLNDKKNEEFNKKLEQDAAALKKTADEFTVDSDEFKKAAKAAGYSIEDATEMVEKGITRFMKATKSVSERGFAAGQEAKTFTDAWEATKDAVSSQWSNLYEKIFGNYEEAKIMWTELANTMWDVFAGPVELLNQVLDVWIELGDREKLFDTESGAIANIWNGLTEVFDIVKEALVNVFPIFNSYENFGMILHDLTTRFYEFTKTLTLNEEQTEKLSTIFEGLFSVIKFVGNTAKTVGEAMGMIFKAILPENFNVTDKIVEIMTKAKSLNDLSSDIYVKVMMFTGRIISKIHEIKNYIASINLENITNNVKAKIQPILDIFKSMGFSMDNINNKVDKFKVSFEQKTGRLEQGTKSIKGFSETIKKFMEPAMEYVHKALDKVSELFDKIKELLSDIPALANKAFGTLFNGIAKITNAFVRMRPNELLTFFNGTLIGGILLGIKKFITNLNKSTKNVTSIADSIKGVAKSVSGTIQAVGKTFDALTNNLEAMQKKVSAETLKSISTSVLMLAGAAVVLSLIDSKQLSTVLTAMAASMSELFIAYYFISEQSGNIQDVAKLKMASSVLMSLAGTLLIVSMALNAFADLSDEQLRNGIIGLAAAIAAIIAFYGAITLIVQNTDQSQKVEMRVKQVSGTMLMLAGAISTLGVSVKLFGQMKLEDLGKGLAGVGVLMVWLYLFMTGITKMTSQVGEAGGFDAKKMLAISVAMNLIAYALIALMVPVLIMGNLSLESLAKGLGGVFILLLEIVMVFEFLSVKIGKDMGAGKILAVSFAMGLLAAAIIGLTIPVVVMGKALDGGQLIRGLLGVAALLVEIGLFTKIISGMNVSTGKLLGVGLSMTMIAISVGLLAGSVKKLGQMELPNLIQGLVATAAMLLMIFGFLKLMSLVSVAELAKAGIVSVIFLGMAFGLTVLGGAIKSFEEVKIETILKALLSMAAVLLIFGGLGAILAPVIPAMIGLAIIIPLIGGGLLLLALGIQAFVTILEETNPFLTLTESIEKLRLWFETEGGQFVLAILDLLWTCLKETVKALWTFIEPFYNYIVDWLSDLFLKIEIKLKEKFNDFKQNWKDGWNTLTKPIRDWVNEFKENWDIWWDAFVYAALNPFKELKEKWTTFWENLGGKVYDVVTFIHDDVHRRFKEAVDGITEFLSPFFELIEKAIEKMTELKDNLSDGWNGFWDNWQSGADQASEWWNGLWGNDTSQSYAAGAAQGEAVIEGAKDSLDINSPSKKAEEEVGDQVTAGVCEGISGTEAKKQLTDSASSAMDTVTDTMVGKLFGSKDELKKAAIEKIAGILGIDSSEVSKYAEKFGGVDNLLKMFNIDLDNMDITKQIDLDSMIKMPDTSQYTKALDNSTLDYTGTVDLSNATYTGDLDQNSLYNFNDSQITTLAEAQGMQIADGMAEGYAQNGYKVTDSINNSITDANTSIDYGSATASGVEMVKRIVDGQELEAEKTLNLVKKIEQPQTISKAMATNMTKKFALPLMSAATQKWQDALKKNTQNKSVSMLANGIQAATGVLKKQNAKANSTKTLGTAAKTTHKLRENGDNALLRETDWAVSYIAGSANRRRIRDNLLSTETGKTMDKINSVMKVVGNTKVNNGINMMSKGVAAIKDLDEEAKKRKTTGTTGTTGTTATGTKSTTGTTTATTGTTAQSATQSAANATDYLKSINENAANMYATLTTMDIRQNSMLEYLALIQDNTHVAATTPVPAIIDDATQKKLVGVANAALGKGMALARRGV